MGQKCSLKARTPKTIANASPDEPHQSLDNARRADQAPGADNFGSPPMANYFERELEELISMAPPVASSGALSRSRHEFKSGSVYDGQWKGNARHGFGVQQWFDGARYEGEWKDNIAEGRGRFQHCSGDVYVGEWKSNVAHGYGIYYHKDLTKYEGEWCKDCQDGYGVEIWADGTRYTGLFSKGFKEGWGVYIFPDGSQFAGAFRQNHFHGCGQNTGLDGRIFRGSWHQSAMHGSGRYSWPDGREYGGQYYVNKRSGFGTFKWPDGRKYQGYWENDCEDGEGKCVNNDGSTMYARWAAGVSSTPRFSARATNQRPEDVQRWDRNRATPRSARSNVDASSSQGNNSSRERPVPQSTSAVEAISKKMSPRSSPRSNTYTASSTRDMSNTEERTALADLPELLEESTDLDDFEDESHGVLTMPVPGARNTAPPPASGRGIGRAQDAW